MNSKAAQETKRMRRIATTALPPTFRVEDDVVENLNHDAAEALSLGAVRMRAVAVLRAGSQQVEWYDGVVSGDTRGLRYAERGIREALRRGGSLVSAGARHYITRPAGVRSGCTSVPWSVVERSLAALAPVLRKAKPRRGASRTALGLAREGSSGTMRAKLRVYRRTGEADVRVELEAGVYDTPLGTPAQAARHLRRALSFRPGTKTERNS